MCLCYWSNGSKAVRAFKGIWQFSYSNVKKESTTFVCAHEKLPLMDLSAFFTTDYSIWTNCAQGCVWERAPGGMWGGEEGFTKPQFFYLYSCNELCSPDLSSQTCLLGSRSANRRPLDRVVCCSGWSGHCTDLRETRGSFWPGRKAPVREMTKQIPWRKSTIKVRTERKFNRCRPINLTVIPEESRV